MAPRSELQAILEEILGSDKVYFQPKVNIELEYPCIIYKRDYAVTEFANNNPYSVSKRYMVTSIDRNPDSQTPDKLAQLQTSIFVRHFTSDDLNHDIYNLYH